MSFKDELNKNTRSTQDVENEQLAQDRTDGFYYAEQEYKKIKKMILEMAKQGKYTVINGKKNILYYHVIKNSRYIKRERHSTMYFTGLFKTNLRGTSEETIVFNQNYKREYDFLYQR